ncbi:hypothetical protein QLQ12_00700 [Actinoplanes sp. NEAU-A12]|uniref:DUF4253 domain-containing protein n=1 Tax=Actinoplanes sandaracinus TaxID=3045177 RepID=A0ABT6WBP3_9ACTN|nr:hypothetical protein [Actinoplanes sandaracinus]MDI6097126.1 hypothetical protein [Actinoplanes sandaracinus]
MGVLHDYFRAPDAAAVVDLMDRHDADSPATVEGWPTGVVEAKGIDAGVALGQLIGFILDEPWTAGLVGGRLIWPAEQDPDLLTAHEGPWVEELGDRARDALAGLGDARIPELAARWARIEELRWPGAPDDVLVPCLTELVTLAGEARDAGEHLYCWTWL